MLLRFVELTGFCVCCRQGGENGRVRIKLSLFAVPDQGHRVSEAVRLKSTLDGSGPVPKAFIRTGSPDPGLARVGIGMFAVVFECFGVIVQRVLVLADLAPQISTFAQ